MLLLHGQRFLETRQRELIFHSDIISHHKRIHGHLVCINLAKVFSVWYPKTNRNICSAGLNASVSLNGSQVVDLDIAAEPYLGQLNLDFSLYDGTRVKYLSEFFNVVHDPSQKPLNWPACSACSQTSYATAVLLSSSSSFQPGSTTSLQPVSTSLLQLSSTFPPQLTPIPSDTTQNSGLRPTAIIGASVGATLGVVVSALVLALLIRRCRIRKSQAGSPTRNLVNLAIPANSNTGAAKEMPGGEVGIEMPAAMAGVEIPTYKTKPKQLPGWRGGQHSPLCGLYCLDGI